VTLNCVRRIAGGVLALMMMTTVVAYGQESPDAKAASMLSRTERADRSRTAPTQTFYLKNCSEPNDGNEILTGLRLMLDPSVKMYLVPSQNAIVVRGLADDMELATKLIAELDRPRKTYRLTYAVTEVDGTKRLEPQRFSTVANAGQRFTLKSGEKVPVVTGSYNHEDHTSQTQMTYLDVGWNFDSTLNATGDGAQLSMKAERSVVVPRGPGPAPTPDPAIRQSVLTGVVALTVGKPVMVGSMAVPDSTRHVEIEATIELMP